MNSRIASVLVSAVLLLCAVAHGQAVYSNSWVGVVANVTNGSVYPQALEDRIAAGGGGGGFAGVSSINSITGAVTLAQGSNVTISAEGQTLTISATGGGGSAVVDTNAIVSAAVEAGRGEFYGLTATEFAEGADEAYFGSGATNAYFGNGANIASFGYCADAADFGRSAANADFGRNATNARFGATAKAAYFGTDGSGRNAATSIVYATSITLGGETRTNWPSGGGGGIANLDAGAGIALATNAQDAVRISIDPNADIILHSVTSSYGRVLGDLRVDGDLNVFGTENIGVIRRYYTNVYLGTQEIWQTISHFETNNVYIVTNFYSRTTNLVDEIINVGGDVDYSGAEWVKTPVYYIENFDTNASTLTASGTWDFTSAETIFPEDCYFTPHVKTPDTSGTNSFSTADFFVQQLDLSAEDGEAEICWNKPSVAPYAFMQCRIKISTQDGAVSVKWATNNVTGFDATKVSTNGLWSWVQMESYPNSASFTAVSQWTESGD